MTLLHPMFPPLRVRPAVAIPIFELTPGQLEALTDLHRLKKEAEREVERLIAFLDMVDGYSMSELDMAVDDEPLPLEDNDDEPSHADTYAMNGFNHIAAGGEAEPEQGWTEEEQDFGDEGVDTDRELDMADDEPSLGWSTTMAHGNGEDLEIECEDEGGQCDDEGSDPDREPALGWHYGERGQPIVSIARSAFEDEPSLGSLNVFDQSGLYQGSLEDLEKGTARRFVKRSASGVLMPLVQIHHPKYGLHKLVDLRNITI